MDEDRTKGKLFVISGPSGAGKGTIVSRVREDLGPDRAVLSISMTTRDPRPGEEDGKQYFFVSKEDFQKKIREGGLLEYAEVYGNYYGTPRSYVMENIENGRDVILEIDIQGALNVKKAFPEGILIFVAPPSLSVLRDRLTGRNTDAEDVIRLRLSKAVSELSHIPAYDYLIINDVLDEAVKKTESIFISEHMRVSESRMGRLMAEYEGE